MTIYYDPKKRKVKLWVIAVIISIPVIFILIIISAGIIVKSTTKTIPEKTITTEDIEKIF